MLNFLWIFCIITSAVDYWYTLNIIDYIILARKIVFFLFLLSFDNIKLLNIYIV